jgi:hypothetical protein
MGNLKVGDKVRVPWGLGDPVNAEISRFGTTPRLISASLFQFEDEDEPFILLLTCSAVEAA